MNDVLMKTVGVVSGLCLLSGCVVIRDTTTTWEEKRDMLEFEGPGAQDAALHRYENDKFELDSGHRIAIGIFPGVAEARDTKEVSSRSGANEWTVLDPIIGTISSLFVAPFYENKISAMGWIGCHRWQSTPKDGKTLVKKGDEETILEGIDEEVGSGASEKVSGNSKESGVEDPRELANGTMLRYAYPGFNVIRADVKKYGQVAVMFERSPDVFDQTPMSYRMFKKSKYVDGALAYEDIAEGIDNAADQLIWRRRLEIVTNDIAKLVHAGEFSRCDEILSNQVFALNKEIDSGLVQNQGFEGDFVRMKQEAIRSLREAANEASKKAIRAKEVNRISRITRQIEKLFYEEAYSNVIMCCEEELKMAPSREGHEEADLDYWRDAKWDAQRELELRRIDLVKKRIEGLIYAKRWKEAIGAVSEERSSSHDGEEKEDEKIWEHLLSQAESGLAAERAEEERWREKKFQEAVDAVRKQMDADPGLCRARDVLATQIALYRTRGEIPAWLNAMFMAGFSANNILTAITPEQQLVLLLAKVKEMREALSEDFWRTFCAEAWDLPFRP